MISPRLARRIASLHKWLGLIVGAQLLVWTATGLYFAAIPIQQIRGEHLVRPAAQTSVDMSRVKLSSTDALKVVVEDRPQQVILRSLAGEPVYEIRAEIGVFLVSAETGQVISPVSEDLARKIVAGAWASEDAPTSLQLLDAPPQEASGMTGQVWSAAMPGEGHRVLYVGAANGQIGPVRTDLWRTYDFLWSLHIMDYKMRENFNHPLIVAAAVLALSVVLFGVALLFHRFTRKAAP
jgi:hypothetical protein